MACLALGCAFVAVPVVHKHAPTQQVPLQEYDASCCFLKAGKIFSGKSSQFTLAGMYVVPLLLFFMTLQPVVRLRIESDAAIRSIFTRKVAPPRAPPAR